MKEIGGFEILSKLGQGGMGAVYKARQISLDRIVALKVLPQNIAKDATFIERFQREARASAKLNHPNIVQGIDVGKDAASGYWYFAMEFVEGPSLRKMLDDQKTIPETRALEITKEVARALEVVAASKMVHRDIKPDNILITSDGSAKLADLGLAKQLNEDVNLTQSGQAVGTPYYMPPELARGQNSACDIRTDIYSLGATLFHLVTGKPPFQGDTGAVIMVKHLTEPAPKASKVNPAVSEGCSRLIEKMMQKKPEQRVQTPADLIVQIDRVLRGEAPAARASVQKTTGPRAPIGERRRDDSKKSNPALMYGALAAGVLLLGGAGYVLSAKKTPAVVVEAKKSPEPVAPKIDAAAKPKNDPPPATAKAIVVKEDVKARNEEQERLKAEWQQVMQRVEVAEKAGDYDGAIHILHSLPPRLGDQREVYVERVKSLQDEADSLITEALKKAEAQSKTDRAQALQTLTDAEKILFAAGRAKIAVLKKKLESPTETPATVTPAQTPSASATAKAPDPAIIEKWSGLLQKFDIALLENNDLKSAGELAAEAKKDAALQPYATQIQALNDVIAAYDDVARFEADEIAKLAGQKIELETTNGKQKGTIGKVQDGLISLNIEIAGGGAAAKKVKITDIVETQRKKLTPPFKPATDAQRVAVSYTRLNKTNRDVPGAVELLNQSPNFPLTEHCQTLAAAVKSGKEKAQTEGAAPTAWAALQARCAAPKISEADAKALLDRFAQFDKEFGASDFVKTNADAIESSRTRVWRVLHPNIVVNGDFEKGSWEGWARSGGSQNSEISTETPRSGKHAMYINIQRDYNATLVQTLTVEPQAEYRVSCWIKYIKGPLDQGRGGIFLIEGDGERKFDESRGWMPLLTKVKAGEWVKVEMSYVPQSPTIKLEFFLRQTSMATDKYYLLIDDIEFARISK